MKGLQMKVLDLGYMELAGSELMAGLGPDVIRSPMSAVLIRHPQCGYILYDTGNDDRWEETYPEEVKASFPIRKLVTIEDALRREGIGPEDIRYLVLSHLHIDHAGGLKFFQNTEAGRQVIVAEDELKDGLYRVHLVPDGKDGVYVRKLFAGLDGIGYSPVKEERKLADGVNLFVQKSHTKGLIGVELELEERGTVLLCGDAVYTEEAFERELPPGGGLNTSSAAFENNVRRLKEMVQKKHARIFFGHDARQAEEWEQQGWIS